MTRLHVAPGRLGSAAGPASDWVDSDWLDSDWVDPDCSGAGECRCPEGDAHDVPLPAPHRVTPGPARFVACADRGQHVRVTDCWVCWSDVHQGVCDLADVVHPDHFDLLSLLDQAALGAPPARPGLHLVTDDA